MNTPDTPGSMLAVLPVPFRLKGGQLHVESQALNGIRCWAKNFERFCVVAPVIPEPLAERRPSIDWVPAARLDVPGVELEPVPWAYAPPCFLHVRRRVRHHLQRLIQRHRYLQFAVGGCLWGDWAAEAARVARRLGRAYSVHTDWVTHQVLARTAGAGIRGWRRKIESWLMHFAERDIIGRATLGLFHGADCYETYKGWCPQSHLVHDVHVQPSDLPTSLQVLQKTDRAREGQPLRVVYAGRAVAMKGPTRWVETLVKIHELRVPYQATWYGEGPELGTMQRMIREAGLERHVSFAGHTDHREILGRLREADVLLFCHMTPESPRILIEALNQGTPIIGFHSAYPADLIRPGGGVLVPLGDTSSLASAVAALHEDRPGLAQLIHEAADAGSQLTDDAVFRHRSALIKRYLP